MTKLDDLLVEDGEYQIEHYSASKPEKRYNSDPVQIHLSGSSTIVSLEQ